MPLTHTFDQRRLALYVYEYLLHVGAQKAAQTFLNEVQCNWLIEFPAIASYLLLSDPLGEEHNTWRASGIPSLLVVVRAV